MNFESNPNMKDYEAAGFHPLGSDRLLRSSVGSTPGTSASYGNAQGHRRLSLRRSLRSLISRSMKDYRHTPSMFGDANAPDFRTFMGRHASTSRRAPELPSD